MSIKIYISLTLALYFIFSSGSLASISTIKEEVAKSVVQISSGNRIASGFMWKNNNWIITTLHSIGDKDDINIFIPNLAPRKAIVKKVLRSADLVLLELKDYHSSNLLSGKKNAKIDENLFTIGFYRKNTAYIDRDFKVGLLGGNLLKDLLPQEIESEIIKLGYPSINTSIIYLKGDLLHGFSGSPVVDLNGILVGISDGGLENGAVGISWCIPSFYLDELELSNEFFPGISSAKTNNLFAERLLEEEEYINYGGLQLTKIKTRTFQELDRTGKYSTSDRLGLIQLLTFFSNGGINYNDFKYDIFLDEKSGATFVIPANLHFIESNGLLVASSEFIDGSNCEMKIFLESTDNGQKSSEIFETRIVEDPKIWFPDLAWTHPAPIFDINGGVLRRRAYINTMEGKYLFEVLAFKEKSFAAACVIRNSVVKTSPYYNLWAQFAIAFQLTSYTN